MLKSPVSILARPPTKARSDSGELFSRASPGTAGGYHSASDFRRTTVELRQASSLSSFLKSQLTAEEYVTGGRAGSARPTAESTRENPMASKVWVRTKGTGAKSKT